MGDTDLFEIVLAIDDDLELLVFHNAMKEVVKYAEKDSSNKDNICPGSKGTRGFSRCVYVW